MSTSQGQKKPPLLHKRSSSGSWWHEGLGHVLLEDGAPVIIVPMEKKPPSPRESSASNAPKPEDATEAPSAEPGQGPKDGTETAKADLRISAEEGEQGAGSSAMSPPSADGTSTKPFKHVDARAAILRAEEEEKALLAKQASGGDDSSSGHSRTSSLTRAMSNADDVAEVVGVAMYWDPNSGSHTPSASMEELAMFDLIKASLANQSSANLLGSSEMILYRKEVVSGKALLLRTKLFDCLPASSRWTFRRSTGRSKAAG